MEPTELQKAQADIKVLLAELRDVSKQLERTQEQLIENETYSRKLELAYNDAIAEAKHKAFESILEFEDLKLTNPNLFEHIQSKITQIEQVLASSDKSATP